MLVHQRGRCLTKHGRLLFAESQDFKDFLLERSVLGAATCRAEVFEAVIVSHLLKPVASVSPNMCYPLVNVYIALENHHFQWENPL